MHFIKRQLLTSFILLIMSTPGFSLASLSAARADVTLSQPLTIRWRYDSPFTLNLTPAADNDRIYLPLASGTIVALRARDGQLYWRSEMGGELSASPVADDGAVYVASEMKPDITKPAPGERRALGTLRALGRDGGVTQWMRTLALPLRGNLALCGNRLLAGGQDGRVYAFNKNSGESFWSYSHGARFNGHPVCVNDRVYLGSEDGNLLAIDLNSGKLLWRYRTRGPVRGPVAFVNDAVHFGSGDGYFYSVNANSGKLSWRKRAGASVESVTLAGETLLVASLDNFVYGFSLGGKRLWKKQLGGRISAQPLTAADGALFTPLSSVAGVVLGLPDGKQINSLPTGEEITTSAAPIAVGDAVLLTTEHGLLAFARPSDHPNSTTKNQNQ
jgi:outer membrane protein assembly factor BamB